MLPPKTNPKGIYSLRIGYSILLYDTEEARDLAKQLAVDYLRSNDDKPVVQLQQDKQV